MPRPAVEGGYPHISELLDALARFERYSRSSYPSAQRRARQAWYELEDYLWEDERKALKAAWNAQQQQPGSRTLELPIARLRRRLERRMRDLERDR